MPWDFLQETLLHESLTHFWKFEKYCRRGIQMDNLPKYIESWVVKRTQEKHYLCRLCSGPTGDDGIEESFRTHLSSWDHKIRVRKMEALRCKVCDIQFRYPSHFNAHVKSKTHKWKVDPSTKPSKDYSCTCCNVTFDSKKDEDIHLTTKKHAKNSAPVSDTASAIFCTMCNLQCKYRKQYEIHLTTTKHARNVAKTDS